MSRTNIEIYRKATEPKRVNLSTEELWHGEDNGLIICWEVGRDMRNDDPALAERVRNGELPILAWKGGVDKALKAGKKYGSLQYLATWLGLRNEDLRINVSKETSLTCARTGVTVTFTPVASKFAAP
jgi:hypothetical protein